MPAAYDTYDYPSYWTKRGYEHKAEVYALRRLLDAVPKVQKVLEIGAGYGRLIPVYKSKGEKIIISDPSAKLLKIARKNNKSNKIQFIQSTLENLDKNIAPKSIDLVIIVRVLHHLKDPQESIKAVSKIIKPNGYLILEYANKIHFKANVAEFLKGNITYTHDIFFKDVKSSNLLHKSLPFYNFHPDKVEHMLFCANFKVLKKRSVSNIRSPYIKKVISSDSLMVMEKPLQVILSKLDFGPSMFILAKRKKVITDYLTTP